MTLQASSSRPIKAARFNPWAHAFWQAAREGWVVTALSLVVYLVLFTSSVIQMFCFAREVNMDIVDLKLYFLFGSQFAGVLPAIMLAAAMIHGVLAFRFIFLKSSGNAWFSLGLARNELFWSRFLAGLAGMLLPIVAAMLPMLFINLAVFPQAGLILTRWLQMTAGLLAQAAALYCISAAVCACVGTVAEGLSYTLLISCFPTAILLGVNSLMTRFLFGCSIGAPEYKWSGFTPELLTDLSSFNPLIFMYDYIGRYASDDGKTLTQVSALPILAWFIAAAVIALLACRLFKNRRAEIAGMMGSNQNLGFTAIFPVAFFAFSVSFMLPEYTIGKIADPVMLLISVASAGAVFCLLAFPLRLAGRSKWKGLLILPAGLAVMLAFVAVLATGGFGYSAYVPAASDVASVSVMYPGNPSYHRSNGNSESGGWVRYKEVDSTPLILTAPDDIAMAVTLHSRILKDGRPSIATLGSLPDRAVFTGTWLKYTLKNGTDVIRYYQYLKTSTAAALLELDTTRAAQDEFAALLAGQMTEQQIGDDDYQVGSIILSSPFLAEMRQIQLDDNQRARLLDCLREDVAALNTTERFFPSVPEICVLFFYRSDMYGNSTGKEIPSFSKDIYVTQKFTRTLAFLRENGFEWAMKTQSNIERIDIVRYKTMVDKNDQTAYSYSPLFQSASSTNETVEQYVKRLGLSLSPVVDGGQIQQILENSHLVYFTADDGYLILVRYRNSDRITSAFLPMKNAPDFVRQTVK